MLNTVVSHGLAKCADRFARGVVPVEAAYEHGNEERGSAPKDLAGQAGQTLPPPKDLAGQAGQTLPPPQWT